MGIKPRKEGSKLMKDRPILFSGPMVRAILDDLKTQTRRTTNLDTLNGYLEEWEFLSFWEGKWNFKSDKTHRLFSVKCPYGQVGDRLWVRETFAPHDGCFIYRASWEMDCPDVSLDGLWKPSIHMPRKASRISLEVVNIRVERLNDITETDAMAEGVGTEGEKGFATHWKAFSTLWESINGAGSWNQNPWVWVVEFKRLEVEA